MTAKRTRAVIRVSALYDFIVTVPFALPWTAAWVFTMLGTVHESLGLAGVTPSPDDPFTLMFANLMGSIVSVWALFRIMRPSIAAGVADTGARLLFSLGMTVALLHGASPLTGVMLALELAWAVAQGLAIVASARTARTPATMLT